MDGIQDVIEAIPQLQAGQIGGMGLIVMAAVRIYRSLGLPWPQGQFSWLGHLLVFLLSTCASLLFGVFAGGLALPTAIAQALSIGAAAIAGNEVTKGIGRTTTPLVERIPVKPIKSLSAIALPIDAKYSTIKINTLGEDADGDSDGR